MAWKTTSARATNRKGNSPYKYMLQSCGFKRTDNTYLKSWMAQRSRSMEITEGSVCVEVNEKLKIEAATVAEAVWIMRGKHGIR